MPCIYNLPVYTSFKKMGIVLDDNSGLYAGTLIFGHDAKRQHRFVESSFRRAHNYSI